MPPPLDIEDLNVKSGNALQHIQASTLSSESAVPLRSPLGKTAVMQPRSGHESLVSSSKSPLQDITNSEKLTTAKYTEHADVTEDEYNSLRQSSGFGGRKSAFGAPNETLTFS